MKIILKNDPGFMNILEVIAESQDDFDNLKIWLDGIKGYKSNMVVSDSVKDGFIHWTRVDVVHGSQIEVTNEKNI